MADFVDIKTVGAAKPRFRLADRIMPNASAKAVKFAFDDAQRQKDMLKQLEITPDLMKQIDYQKEMEKLISNSAGRLADALYPQEAQRHIVTFRQFVRPVVPVSRKGGVPPLQSHTK
ncbi:MAG: hypothetical protein WBI05_10040 [Rhodoferax sp.]|uniref:hypothetical protein n=1 Tax=Rhodoferax sp. TaxID=50421 RepID=UPI003BB6DFF1